MTEQTKYIALLNAENHHTVFDNENSMMIA